jgi:multiple sugar transport system substrate-binding protein
MTEYELLRIITFLERMRGPYDRLMKAAEPDANWNITLYLMKHHLRGENVTMSSLASAADIPFASAMRRIHKLIDTGDIQLRKRGASGKSFFLEPSRKLVISFTDYAKSVKALLADTFGLKSGSGDAEDYYFGGSYLAGQIIPPLDIMEKGKETGPPRCATCGRTFAASFPRARTLGCCRCQTCAKKSSPMRAARRASMM